MKKATLRQKNISNDIKVGLIDLEDAFDAFTYGARLKKRPEARLPMKSHTITESEEAPDTPSAAGSKKRPATSPADRKALLVKKIRDETQTPEGARVASLENPRPRKERRRTNLEATAAETNAPESSRPNDEREVTQRRISKRRGKRRRFRPEALIIRPAEGKTYAQVLAEMRSKVDPEATEAEVQSIRQTRAGDILLELGPKSKNKEGFCGALRHALGDQAKILSLEPKVSLEIRDLDGFTTVEEVKAALKREISETGLKVNLFPRSRGQQVAVIEMEERLAAKLLNEGRLKIGWVYCRVRERIVVTRCFRCSGYGHMAKDCTGPDRSKQCYKCLAVGHKARGCTAAANCVLCNDRGIEQAQLNHFPGSGKCQVYREALQAAQKQR